jgi:hypothetical protein
MNGKIMIGEAGGDHGARDWMASSNAKRVSSSGRVRLDISGQV